MRPPALALVRHRRQPSTPASALPSANGTSSAQTDTEWGRIWDNLPADFPTYPGATPAEETATGAASADLVITGGDARTVATTMQSALTAAGYTTAGLSGPLEDGSFTLDMTGPPTGCKLELRVTPTGGLTSLKILYGAGCPQRLIRSLLPRRIAGGASTQRRPHDRASILQLTGATIRFA